MANGTGNGGGWAVTSQSNTVGLDDTGRAVDGYKVGFVTAKGVHASVFVPRSKYNPDYVKQVIASHASDIDAVHGLSG